MSAIELALVAPESFARSLNGLGISVTTGPTVREASQSALQALKDRRSAVLIVAASDFAVAEPVITVLSRRKPDEQLATVVLQHPGQDFPVQVADLCDRLGIATPEGHGDDYLLADGSLQAGVSATRVARLPEPEPEPAAAPSSPPGWNVATVPDAQVEPVPTPTSVDLPKYEPIELPVRVEPETRQTAPAAPAEEHWWYRQQRAGQAPIGGAAPTPAPAVAADPAHTPAVPAERPARDAVIAIASRRARHDERFKTHRGDILIVWSTAGGAGKTATSSTIAQTAAEAGLRALLISANRGQPDLTVGLLRSTRLADTPTIHRAIDGDARDAVATAEHINASRAPAPAVGFDAVFGPHAHEHSLDLHTAELYLRVIEQLRPGYDLVVIDTQTLDNDLSDIWVDLLIPLLKSGAWGLGLTDQSIGKVDGLRHQLGRFEALGVPMARQLVAGAIFDELDEEDAGGYTGIFRPADFIGATTFDADYARSMRDGSQIVTGIVAVDPAVRKALFRITGSQAFAAREYGQRRQRRWIPRRAQR